MSGFCRPCPPAAACRPSPRGFACARRVQQSGCHRRRFHSLAASPAGTPVAHPLALRRQNGTGARSRMGLTLLLDAVTNANLNGVRLAMRDRQLAREYWAQSVRRYYELMGFGLQPNDPVAFIYKQGWSTADRCDRAQLPLTLQTNGITRLDELLVLAMATCALRPATVFEIGTFMGHSTSVLILNAPASARIYSID